MKGLAFLLALILIGGYLYLNGYVKVPEDFGVDKFGETEDSGAGFSENSSAQSLRDELIKAGLKNVYVSLSPEETLVQFEVEAVDQDLIPALYSVAESAYSTNPAENLRVEAYFGDEPLMALAVKNGDFEGSAIEDIRRPGFRVENVLGLFDVVIHNVTVTNESVRVSLEYLAGEESFWRDYGRMSFAVLQSVPWVERVEIVYLGERNVSVSMNSEDVLRMARGELTREELAGAITLREPISCPSSEEEAYRLFVNAYNNVTSLQQANASQEALEEAYARYLEAKACYGSFNSTFGG